MIIFDAKIPISIHSFVIQCISTIDSPEISSSFAKIENLTESSAPFSLRCSVEAFPKATVTWYYNGDVSHENSTETFHRITNAKILVQSILTFPNGIKRYNNGTFTCNANNSVGSASKSVLINVWCK